MTEEYDSALAIAKLDGEMKAIRAENEAMESRIDTSLANLRTEMATYREDAAKRETRLLLSIAVMITLAVSIISLVVLLPAG
ncbi:MAG: hypothetical protein OXE94_05020 [Aestuariivita sp.]|nr:hypothetical protein [Aestuariivita sp.]MCY4201941.1 hypothetical protein [Aestuariivita sp.]MCY4288827.1 hypothetical protein [Aestuariivita sp.]MCY4345252.1 hypothetical protein [Aestuariivita sp.]